MTRVAGAYHSFNEAAQVWAETELAYLTQTFNTHVEMALPALTAALNDADDIEQARCPSAPPTWTSVLLESRPRKLARV